MMVRNMKVVEIPDTLLVSLDVLNKRMFRKVSELKYTQFQNGFNTLKLKHEATNYKTLEEKDCLYK